MNNPGKALAVAAMDHRNKSEGDSEKMAGAQRQSQKDVIAGLVPAIHVSACFSSQVSITIKAVA
jgi:hypothetical protein